MRILITAPYHKPARNAQAVAGATHEVEDHHVAIMNRRILQWFPGEKVNQ